MGSKLHFSKPEVEARGKRGGGGGHTDTRLEWLRSGALMKKKIRFNKTNKKWGLEIWMLGRSF